MRTSTLKRTVKRLAARAGSAASCPACARRPPVTLREGQEALTCALCGRGLPVVLLRRDPNFYGNAERLRREGARQGQEERYTVAVPEPPHRC
jgi:hypothetical protein